MKNKKPMSDLEIQEATEILKAVEDAHRVYQRISARGRFEILDALFPESDTRAHDHNSFRMKGDEV